jgi:hypothetical protein
LSEAFCRFARANTNVTPAWRGLCGKVMLQTIQKLLNASS